MTEAGRRRLAQHVSQRRRALGMSLAEAARTAEVNIKTWDALEKASRSTRDSNYAGIERALRWRAGSIEAVLDGGKPQPDDTSAAARQDPAYVDPVTGEEYTDPAERELWSLARFPEDERRKLIYYARSERARQAAERQRRAAG